MGNFSLLLFICFVLLGISCLQQPAPTLKQSIITTTGKGDIVIYKPETDQAVFITKSGVVFKTVSIANPAQFETHKHFEVQIHNTIDSIFVDAEWIGDKVYWNANTNGLNTRNANSLALSTFYGSHVVPLCGLECNWVPIFDPITGKTTNYSASGIVNDISIDAWLKAMDFSYRALSK